MVKLVHGNAITMVDHTAAADIAAGDVIVATGAIRIAHRAIDKDALGALAAGGGVYDVPKAGGAGVTFADGAAVYWDAENEVAVATDGGDGTNKRIGLAVKAAVNADTTVRVQHIPN